MATATLLEMAPSHRDDGGSSKTSSLEAYYGKLGAWCDSAFEEARANQEDVPELKEMSRSIDYLLGMQWSEAMPSFRARPVSNEVLMMYWETIGLLTDLKPFFNVKDIGGDGQYSKIESILNKLARGWGATARFERTLASATMYGMLTTAPAKIYWNPFARGSSGDPSDGDISFEALPAKSLLRLGISEDTPWDIQDDECVIYRRTRTLDWIKRAYPKMGVLVRPDEARSRYSADAGAPLQVMPQLFQNLSPAAKRMVGGNDKTQNDSVYPRAEVREFWKKDDSINESPNKVMMGPKGAAWSYVVDPGKKLYPRGRLIIQANRVILYDEPNPYWHRKYPFALLGLYAVPWQQYAMSVMSPWLKQQDILNQLLAGIIQTVKKAVSPPLIAPKSAIHPESMRMIDSAKPGLKITYSQNSPTPPIWGQPPNLPGYVLQTYGMVKGDMKQSSGSAAADAAAGKKQVPGGDTLDKLTFAKNTPIRMMGRNMEGFVDEVGGQWVANALQFYDAAQRMELLGDQGLTKEDTEDVAGSLIPEGINSEAFVRRFRFKCDKGTLLNVQRQDRQVMAFALRKGKDLSRNKLFDVLDWNVNREENEAELLEEAKKLAAAMGAGGGKPHK